MDKETRLAHRMANGYNSSDDSDAAAQYIRKLEEQVYAWRAQWREAANKLASMEAQRNKFVHKYRKVCKAYNWLCHVTNRRFKAEDRRAYKHLPELVRQYEIRRQKKDKG